MNKESRYIVGIDVGTTAVRCVVGYIDDASGIPTIVGSGVARNNGMRKGTVANPDGPYAALDEALGIAEQMSGAPQFESAAISINGSHIFSTKVDGMIAVSGGPIQESDLERIAEVATMGKIPQNREILDTIPHIYRLDGQEIKDPYGMTGSRLEMSANVVSAITPNVQAVYKVAEKANVQPSVLVPSVLAAGRASLTESQLENGVAVIDFGGSTTSIAIYEEGDVQYVSVLPVGSINITNDLAIGLKTDPEVAEKIKIIHAQATLRPEARTVNVKLDKENYDFPTTDIDEIVEARLDEIFEAIQKEFKKAGRVGKLPAGVVLTGGGANLKNLVAYTKEKLGVAARIAKNTGFGGVVEEVHCPEFSTAVGLMLLDNEGALRQTENAATGKQKKQKSGENFFGKILSKFK